jgi:hypothetical protein
MRPTWLVVAIGGILVACGSGAADVDGMRVRVVSVERVAAIDEEHAKIRTEAGREFAKVVLAVEGKGRPPAEVAAAIRGWTFSISDEAGKSVGPTFGWRFIDEGQGLVRVYSNPVPTGTKLGAVTVEGRQVSLKGR